MNTNFKLYFKYILLNTNQIFLHNLLRHDTNTNILVPQKSFYYLMLHLKLSSLFYSLQLSDLFSYELPINNKNTSSYTNSSLASSTSLIVYNFHSIFTQQRFFIFVLDNSKIFIQKNNYNSLNCSSLTELFLNAN
jgi:hypothetical protein